jgi:hypothetical protein
MYNSITDDNYSYSIEKLLNGINKRTYTGYQRTVAGRDRLNVLAQ